MKIKKNSLNYYNYILEKYSIYEILQILDINVFELININQPLKNLENKNLQKSYVFEKCLKF